MISSHTRSSTPNDFELSPGGTRNGAVARPAALGRGARRGQMIACHGLVADDRDFRARPQRRNALPERGQYPAADHDLVAALAERHIDDDRIAGSQRHGHGARSPDAASAALSRPKPRWGASSLTISSTIRSCGTSRD